MSTQPTPDPTGDLRADFLARLEYDLMPWSDRRDITRRESETER